MTYTVIAVRKITDFGDQTITETNKTEAQRDKFIKKWEAVGYTVSYTVEGLKPLSNTDILDFYNEHVNFTGEITINDVNLWVERRRAV